jgi:hypothetical protein
VSQRHGSGRHGCLGCLGFLVLTSVLAWPIDTLGHVAGWSTTTTGEVELAWFALLAIGLRLWRRRVRAHAGAPAPSRVVSSAPRRRDFRAAPRSTQPQDSIPRRDPIPAQLRFKVLQRDGFRCQYCGRGAREDGIALHADHVVPVVAGGETSEGNLLTACAACNLGKAARAVLP